MLCPCSTATGSIVCPPLDGLTFRPSLDIIVPEEPDGGTLWALCAGSVETPASDVVTSGFFFFAWKGDLWSADGIRQ